MGRKILLYLSSVILFLSIVNSIYSQDTTYVRSVLVKLSSEKFKGRGYVGNGDLIAAKFIANEFKKSGAKPIGVKGYFQPYNFAINSFPSAINFFVKNKRLEAGKDFLIANNSPTTKGRYQLIWYKGEDFSGQSIRNSIGDVNLNDKFLVIPSYDRSFVKNNPLKARGIICLSKDEKLLWSVSNGTEVVDFVTITIKDELLPEDTKEIKLEFRNKFLPNHITNNVVAYVPGTEMPDSFLVYTAHYDHLGMMGKKACFYGANDNASGTSMILDLAKYYAVHPAKYTMVFIAFSGEEAGLLGSKYYASNPTLDLSKMKFLINLDMVGSGSDGITVVNAGVYKEEFDRMQNINKKNSYLAQVKFRGESCNSDHCPFYQKGVPSFFIYTMGNEYSEYHNIYDKGVDVPLTAYSNLFRLLLDFNSTF